MSISTKRIQVEVTIAGQTQSATTESVMGRIDQIILESSCANQVADFILKNDRGQEIYRKDQILINTIVNDLRPDLLPSGIVVVMFENPLNVGETITVTFIEKERGE